MFHLVNKKNMNRNGNPTPPPPPPPQQHHKHEQDYIRKKILTTNHEGEVTHLKFEKDYGNELRKPPPYPPTNNKQNQNHICKTKNFHQTLWKIANIVKHMKLTNN
jgi:hypothetical protein